MPMASLAPSNFDFQFEIAPADGIRLPFPGSGDLGTSVEAIRSTMYVPCLRRNTQ
jgi:hypothetical protein